MTHRTKDSMPTQVMFRAHNWRPEIESFEVVKITECYITYLYKSWNGKLAERRERHEGKFFKTWDEAKAELERRAVEEVRRSEEHLQRVRSTLGQVRALRQA